MSKVQRAWSIVNESEWQRIHRTMLAIYIDSYKTDNYIERLIRFVSSLNRQDTIKADVFLVFDGALIYAGKDEMGIVNLDYPVIPKGTISTERRTCKSLRDFAKSKGYVQISILESCENEWP